MSSHWIGLDLPLTKVKTKLLNDGDDDLVVSAPLVCGKTTLATQLCHDEEIKENFAYIFFCVVLSVLPLGPLYRLYSITAVTKHQKDSEAVDGLRKLIAEINIQDFKILVISRFEFPSFGPAYHFETFGRGARSLLIERASPRYHVSMKILYK
ncbi:hypothetical protein HID58_061563, partial [Brassica napus]